MGSSGEKDENTKKVTSRQVVAIAGILLLALLYIVTLIVAIFDNSESGRWFMLCIFATVAVPILLWVYTWMYGKLTGRHTIANSGHFSDNADLQSVPDVPDGSEASDNS